MKLLFDETCDPIKLFDKPLSHLLYADDLVLLSTSGVGLNKCLKEIHNYCEKWHLEVNIKKSKILVFNSTGKKLSGQNFWVNGGKLEVVQSYCYLGIELSSSGSFRLAKTNLMDKARKAMFPLYSTISQFNLQCSNSLKLFRSWIRPIILYGTEVWGHFSFHQIKAIMEKRTTLFELATTSQVGLVQHKFLKFLLGVKSNCSNTATLGEVGEYPLLLNGILTLLKFWHRTAKLPNNFLAKQALKSLSTEGVQCEWLATVKCVLSQLNMEEHFYNHDIVDTDKFADICLTKLKAIFEKQWHTRLTSTSKLRFYKLFKTSFSREKYLDFIPTFPLRKCLTKFRCSDHRLEVEVGRHNNIVANERWCMICKIKVETEEHFLRFCPGYNTLRARLFGNLRSFLQWRDLLKCDKSQPTFKLIKFINKGFEIRKNLIESNLNPNN